MKRSLCALLLSLAVILPAGAQPAPRVKGRIADFDGLTFHLAPEGGGAPLAVRLQPRTTFMAMEKRALSAIKTGAYVGATVRDQKGALSAEEVHLYPDGLRGSSEGRLDQGGGRVLVTGAVTGVGSDTITVFYRGAQEADGVCQGRSQPLAPSPPCTADPVIRVPRGVPVTALVPGDRRLLVVGAIATVSIETDAKGVKSTPGLILETPPPSQ